MYIRTYYAYKVNFIGIFFYTFINIIVFYCLITCIIIFLSRWRIQDYVRCGTKWNACFNCKLCSLAYVYNYVVFVNSKLKYNAPINVLPHSPPPSPTGPGWGKMELLTAFYCNNFLRVGALDSTVYARGFSLVVRMGRRIWHSIRSTPHPCPTLAR